MFAAYALSNHSAHLELAPENVPPWFSIDSSILLPKRHELGEAPELACASEETRLTTVVRVETFKLLVSPISQLEKISRAEVQAKTGKVELPPVETVQ